MKLAIVCEKRLDIASFVKKTLHLTGYRIVDVITEIADTRTYLDDNTPFILFTDIALAYTTKQAFNTLLKAEEKQPSLSFYQVENNQVTGFWNEGILEKQLVASSDNIFIRTRGRLEKVHKENILYIESDKKYCTIHTLHKKYVLRTALKHLFEQLNHVGFVRVHRSFLINKNHIMAIDTQNQNVTVKNTEIPIGRFYQQNLFQQINILQ